MNILITLAVEQEFAPWRKLWREWQESASAAGAFEWVTGENRVCVVLTGMSCRKPWQEAARKCAGGGFDICISSGLAGGLDPGLHCGDIVVADAVQRADGLSPIPCDAELVELAASSGARVAGNFFSSRRVLVTKEEKAAARRFGEAVEMESWSVLETMRQPAWAVRSVAIRAISDEAGEDLPLDFNERVTPNGEADIASIAASVARQPSRVPALIRFASRSKEAAGRLAKFLDNYTRMLASKSAVQATSEQ
jgi:nucleoside phosphorylase